MAGLAAAVAALLGLVGCAAARGRLVQPPVTTSYSVTIEPSIDPAFANLDWNHSSRHNTHQFAEAFRNSSFASIRAIVDSAKIQCEGLQRAVDMSSLRAITWTNDEHQVGFNDHGPCEAWIDDLRIFSLADCRTKLAGNPAEVGVDFSICQDNCIFAFYWLVLSSSEWEANLQCAPITYSTGTPSWSRRLGLFKMLDAGMDALFGDKSVKEHAVYLFEAAKKFSFSNFIKNHY